MSDSKILLVEAPDRKGLIATITSILVKHDINILKNDEYVDPADGTFFMRASCEGDFDLEEVKHQLNCSLPAGSKISIKIQRKKPIVIMVTKEPYCLGDLLIRCVHGDMQAETEKQKTLSALQVGLSLCLTWNFPPKFAKQS